MAYPGAEVVVGAETPGTIVAVRVREKAIVRAGELLVEFKADELKASLDEAAARVTEAEAELDFQQKEVALMERLIQRKAGTDEERERIRSRLIVARAGGPRRPRRTSGSKRHSRRLGSPRRSRASSPCGWLIPARRSTSERRWSRSSI